MVFIKYPGNSSFAFDIHFTEVEQIFHYEPSLTNKVFGALIFSTIIFLNIPLLIYIFKHGKSTFINKLIAIDCCLCIGNFIPAMNVFLGESRIQALCLIFPPSTNFINSLNSLLSLAIVFYRFVFVLKSSWVRTDFQKQIFCSLVAGTIGILSTTLAVLCFI